jgi:hypothetical protein
MASFTDPAGAANTLDLKLWARLLLLLVSLNTEDLASLFPSAYLKHLYKVIRILLDSVRSQWSLGLRRHLKSSRSI